jgi:hypothetical protein
VSPSSTAPLLPQGGPPSASTPSSSSVGRQGRWVVASRSQLGGISESAASQPNSDSLLPTLGDAAAGQGSPSSSPVQRGPRRTPSVRGVAGHSPSPGPKVVGADEATQAASSFKAAELAGDGQGTVLPALRNREKFPREHADKYVVDPAVREESGGLVRRGCKDVSVCGCGCLADLRSLAAPLPPCFPRPPFPNPLSACTRMVSFEGGTSWWCWQCCLPPQ